MSGSCSDAAGVLKHRAPRVLSGHLGSLDLPAQLADKFFLLTQGILGAFQAPPKLVHLRFGRCLLAAENVTFAGSLADERGCPLERVAAGHTSVAFDDANWTLNVNDGVLPVIVQLARWY